MWCVEVRLLFISTLFSVVKTESINPNCGVNPRRRKKRKDETFGPEGDERNVREAVQVLLRQRVPRQARHQRRLLLHNLNKMGNRFVFFAIWQAYIFAHSLLLLAILCLLTSVYFFKKQMMLFFLASIYICYDTKLGWK